MKLRIDLLEHLTMEDVAWEAEANVHLKGLPSRRAFLVFQRQHLFLSRQELSLVLFSDLPAVRKREVGSAVAHYVAGGLDRDAMTATVDSLWQSARLAAGGRVRTLRSSLRGIIVRLLEDGWVVWRAESDSELVSLPESLCADD